MIQLATANHPGPSAASLVPRGIRVILPALTFLVGALLPLLTANPGMALLVAGLLVTCNFVTSANARIPHLLAILSFVIVCQVSEIIGSGEIAVNLGVVARSAILVVAILQIQLQTRISRQSRKLILLATYGIVLAITTSVALGYRNQELSSRLISNYSNGDGTLRATSWFPSPNELGLVSVLLLVGISVHAIQSKATARYVCIPFILLVLYCLLQSGTRSSVVAVYSGAIILAVAATIQMRVKHKPLTVLAVLVGIGYYVSATRIYVGGREVLGRDFDGSAVYRKASKEILWQRVYSGMADWFGQGTSSGGQLRITALNAGVSNIDSSLLYMLVGYGLVALLILIAVFAYSLFKSLATGKLTVCLLIAFLTVSYSEDAVSWIPGLVVLQGMIILGGGNEEERHNNK